MVGVLVKLSEHSEDFLLAYLQGSIGEERLGEWLIEVEWGKELRPRERDVLAGLRLLLIEYGEDMRTLREVKSKAAALVAASRPGEVISYSSDSSPTSRQEITVL